MGKKTIKTININTEADSSMTIQHIQFGIKESTTHHKHNTGTNKDCIQRSKMEPSVKQWSLNSQRKHVKE